MEDTLRQLRAVRDELRRADGLRSTRDRLVREAVEHHSRRRVAVAAGISASQVQRIIRAAGARR